MEYLEQYHILLTGYSSIPLLRYSQNNLFSKVINNITLTSTIKFNNRRIYAAKKTKRVS